MPWLLRNIDVLFISLVTAGANKREVVYKRDDGTEVKPQFERCVRIGKADDAQQVIYGIVYAPGSPDDTDTQGDFTTKDEVRAMAYAFMVKGRNVWGVDRDHTFRALQEAYVAESWIVEKGDTIFGDARDDGAWAVGIKITDANLYNELKNTGYKGLSMAGTAERVEVEAKSAKGDEPNSGWLQRIKLALGIKPKEDLDVDEIKKAVEALTATVKSLSDKFAAMEKAAGATPPAGNPPAQPPDLAKALADLQALTDKMAKLEAGEKPAAQEVDLAALAKQITELVTRVEKIEKAKTGSHQQDPKGGESAGLGLL